VFTIEPTIQSGMLMCYTFPAFARGGSWKVAALNPFRTRIISLFAKETRDKAVQLRPGPEKDALLKKARQADTASKLDEWANSPGLQPPK
jgi:hypothetical protein